MVADIARIDERIDRVAAGAVAVSDALGGVRFQNMMEVMEFAKLMAVAGNAVPKHLQGNPGSCLAVCIQALEWGFSPFSVASMHFEVNGRHAFMSQLIHAVIEKHAPLKQRLRCEYEGENGEMICIVTGHIRGEVDPLIYRSPKISAIPTKNSPLWKSDPQQQLWYFASRSWCRRFCPDILLGVYAREEIDEHIGPDNAKDVTEKPGVAARLTGGKDKGRGFSASHVERETTRGVVDETATEPSAPADAGSDQVTASAPANSSQPTPCPPSPQAETKPTLESSPELTSVGATTSPPPPAEQQVPDGDPKQATESGNAAQDGSGGLPAGWEKLYAAALGRAQKIGSLSKYAAEFWKDYGTYAAIKTSPHYDTAESIYAAFRDHFGEAAREAREVILHELNAA